MIQIAMRGVRQMNHRAKQPAGYKHPNPVRVTELVRSRNRVRRKPA